MPMNGNLSSNRSRTTTKPTIKDFINHNKRLCYYSFILFFCVSLNQFSWNIGWRLWLNEHQKNQVSSNVVEKKENRERAARCGRHSHRSEAR